MQPRTRIFYSAITLLLCLFKLTPAKATHFAAIDISVRYECSGPTGLDYRVILDVYYACEPGSSAPSAAFPINYFSVNEGGAQNAPYGGNRSSNATQVGVEDVVDQLCDKTKNSCAQVNSGFPGFRHRRYETLIPLTSRQTDWVFYMSSGARNAGILNISTNATSLTPQGNIFVEAGLDNKIRVNNETPIFAVQPLPYLCINQSATYLNAPFDASGDSLEVLSVTPRQNFNLPYFYYQNASPPLYYTASNPIASASTDPYTVNPSTGSATFTPTLQGKFVLAFRCNKYDRKTGKLIGFIHRDVQVSVLSTCNGTPPELTDPQNVQNGALIDGKYITCSGNTFQFDMTASSGVANRKLYMTANLQSLPGLGLQTAGDGTTNVTGSFTWTPHYGNIGEHLLIVTGYDSTCDVNSPIVLKKHKIIIVKIIPSIDAGFDKTFCIGDSSKPVELYVRGADNYRLRWSDIDGGPAKALSNDTIQAPLMYPHKLPAPGTEVTYMIVAPDVPAVCKNRDTVTLRHDTTNSINVLPDNPIILCRPDYLQMDVIIKGRPLVTALTCGIAPKTDPKIEALKPIDSLWINGNLSGSYDTLGPVTPTFPADMPNVKQQFLVRRGDILESGLLYHTIKGIAFEAKAVDPTYQYNNFKISFKCTPELSVSCTKNFQDGMTNVFTATGPVTFAEGLNKFVLDNAYNWDTTQNLIVEICYSGNPATASGINPIIKFVPTDYISNLLLADATTNVCPVLTSDKIVRTYTRPQFMFYYTETIKPFVVTWYPGTLLSDSTIQQPLAYVPETIVYYSKAIGRNGCLLIDSAAVYVPKHNYSVWPADTAICFGEPAPLHTKDGFTYKWYEYKDGVYTLATRNATCWDCADPILTPKATTIYKIVVYDSVWCTDTLTARVEVMPLPDVHILNRDTIVKYGQSIQLLVNGARTYNWFQVGTMTNTNISNPIARPTERTDYVVGGIGKNGCRAYDTVTVDVDFRDNLFIPSAFSPNGDGKNDVFRISNLSFQRVLEFRVFNRWGQEVFYSNDNQHGWDGKWKGVPQDLSSYQYLIRLGYPDGLVETYKGEVTLVK
jgi:gliding motility-associated-like protein